jgi:hypothetical protein
VNYKAIPGKTDKVALIIGSIERWLRPQVVTLIEMRVLSNDLRCLLEPARSVGSKILRSDCFCLKPSLNWPPPDGQNEKENAHTIAVSRPTKLVSVNGNNRPRRSISGGLP